mgnify:FL=1
MDEPVEIAPGVRALDHTADVGIEVRAASPAQLFHRAALGMLALLEDAEAAAAEPGASAEPAAGEAHARELALDAEDLAMLLVLWLRELLYLYEVERFRYRAAEFARLDERGLQARVRGEPARAAMLGELKAVTYHGLAGERDGGGWYARVIFDV